MLSREQYLTEAKAELLSEKKQMVETMKKYIPVRSAAEQETNRNKEKMELEDKSAGPAQRARLKILAQLFKSDEDYLKENIEAKSAGFDKTLQLIDSLIQFSTPNELEKTAMVSRAPIDFRGFEDSSANRQVITRWNMDYFDKKSSKEKPQFMTIILRYDPTDLTPEFIDRKISTKINFSLIQQLLENKNDKKGKAE